MLKKIFWWWFRAASFLAPLVRAIMRLFASALVALWIASWCEALVVPAAPGLRVRGRARRVRAGASFDDVPEPAPKIRYSGGDWWPQLTSAPRSKILRRVQSHALFNVAIACAAAAWRGGGRDALPGALHSLTAGSLSLLLVFRTNAAYDRWWEARKAWGLVLAASRELKLSKVCCSSRGFSELVELWALGRLLFVLQICWTRGSQGFRMFGFCSAGFLDSRERMC